MARELDRPLPAGCLGILLLALIAPAGAQTKPPIANHNFPTAGPTPAPIRVVRAFPALRFTRPLHATHAPDGSGRIFVVEQDGAVWVFPNVDATTDAKLFLDLRGKVLRSGNEDGLLGLEFDPAFRTNGQFYVHYKADAPPRSVISRFRVSASDPDRADPASEVVVLTADHPSRYHNGGRIAFGPDDMLYIAIGDGGESIDTAQDMSLLRGKILRIDPSRPSGGKQYTIPADNPFVGKPGARAEIWALGLRNVWSFAFDRQTGELWAGDVGQDRREEIDLIRRGGNYGWSVYEGSLPYKNPNNIPPDRFDAPLLEYDPVHGRCVIGGLVYRGQLLPALRGAYLYGDNSSGRIQAVVTAQGKVVSNTMIGTLLGVAAFAEAPDGEPLLVSYNLGTLHRMLPATGGGKPFPGKLSDTGLFTDLKQLVPAPGVLPYDVVVPFWSDGATKRRWITWQGADWGFHAQNTWSLPERTVLVKQFEIAMVDGDPNSIRRLETRVLVHEQAGWAGYVYRWLPDQSDALLLQNRETEELVLRDPKERTLRQQTWLYPSRTDCMQCHTTAAGILLGIRTPQLNRPGSNGNQVAHWNQAGMFGRDVGSGHPALPRLDDAAQTIAARARAWLDVNCAMCHLPNGTGRTTLDLRWTTPDSGIGAIDVRPQLGDLGLPDAHLIKSGVRESSVVWDRIGRRDEYAMPRLGSSVIDAAGRQLVGEWIGSPFRSLGAGCAGRGGTPNLQIEDHAWARIAQPWVLRVTYVPESGPITLGIGASATRWQSHVLPLDLGPLGMPGCSLRTSLDWLFPMTRTTAGARLALAMPNDPRLVGVRLYQQALVLDRPANAAGLTVSNGTESIVLRR